MPKTQKPWAVDARNPGRSSAGLVIAMLSAIAMMYVLIAFHPRLLDAAETALTATRERPEWVLPAVAAAALIAAAALALLVLARIARGVRTEPYAWSAPVVVGLSCVAMGQLQVQLPLGVHVVAFASCSSFLMMIGGAVLQMREPAAKTGGLVLLTFPLVSLLTSYVLTAGGGMLRALAALNGAERSLGLLLGSTTIGVIILSSVTQRRDATPQSHHPDAVRAFHERLEQGALELEQARRRARQAEQAVGMFAPAHVVRSQLLLGASTLVLFALLAGAYSTVYLPLAQRVRTQQNMLEEAAVQQRAALESARARFASELDALKTQLDRERDARDALVSGPAAQNLVVYSADALTDKLARTTAAGERPTNAPHAPDSTDAATAGDWLTRPTASSAARAAQGRGATHQVVGAAKVSPQTKKAQLRAKRAAMRRERAAHKSARATRSNATTRASRTPGTSARTVAGAVAAEDDPIGGLEGL
jgi:hypothetical protein